MKVAIFGRGRPDSREVRIATAMAKGARRHGHEVIEFDRITGKLPGDLLISYGWIHELTDQMFSRYKKSGRHYVFVDLGYWNRSQTGHHRIAIDDWDSAKSLKYGMPDNRLNRTGMGLRNDWDKASRQIMVAGMSGKAARSHGYKDQQWEDDTLRTLKELVPEYEVFLRPKPRKGQHFAKQPRIVDALKTCYMVASHHSNVSVDCLWAGVPYWCVKGVGKRLSLRWLSEKDIRSAEPPSEAERRQLLADISYVQYDLKEMAGGVCFDYIKGFVQ